jgi:hypothetical protein
MNDERLEIQKRLTLNWLIQGVAQHAGMTAHHLVRDELNALDPRLLRLYDQFALMSLLYYWHLTSTLLFGWPPRFWKRAATQPDHLFFGHPLLSKYGGMLAEAGRHRARERRKEKGVALLPLAFSLQLTFVLVRLRHLERPHRARLIQLAKESVSTVWGIPVARLQGELSDKVVAGDKIPAQGNRAALLQAGVKSYGGVVQRDDVLMVYGKGTTWQLLTHELVKGTAELICLHGLTELSDETYQRVIAATDRLEFEPWMLQSGAELWRRLLAAVPTGCSVARVMMCLARQPARILESIIADVIERQEQAQERLAEIAEERS